jgi:tRNA (guanine37-N1)-methyltransferase
MEYKASYIGDAAILSLPPGANKREIAGSVLAKRKSVRIVLNKVSKAEDGRRVPLYEVLAGGDTVVTYKEFGFTYYFDVTRVFFSGRLSYERRRIAEQISPGESVYVPFAGVGPFAIPIAARGCRVVAVEMSREACRWLALNARANRVDNSLAVINADAFSVCFNVLFDRVVIPAPYGMDHILDTMVPMVKSGGKLHFYTFKKKRQIEGLIKQYENIGLEVTLCRRCGNVAPGASRWDFALIKQ